MLVISKKMTARTERTACPNCSTELGASPVGSRVPYTECPFCRVPLTHAWWQRILVTLLALVLAFLIPASFGLRGILLLAGALICYFPALVIAMILFFKTIPAKYAMKGDSVTTLFRK